MTETEITIIQAMSRVTFFTGTKTKLLVRDLANMAAARPTYELTERQRAAICRIAYRFRRQLSPEIVKMAADLQLQQGQHEHAH